MHNMNIKVHNNKNASRIKSYFKNNNKFKDIIVFTYKTHVNLRKLVWQKFSYTHISFLFIK